MTKPDLLPCPFCGGEAEVNSYGEGDYVFTISCENKKCAINPRVSFDEEDRYNGNFDNIQDLDSLYDAWNTRTPNKSAEVDLDWRGQTGYEPRSFRLERELSSPTTRNDQQGEK